LTRLRIGERWRRRFGQGTDWFCSISLRDESKATFNINIFRLHPEELRFAKPLDVCVVKRVLVKRVRNQNRDVLSGQIFRRDTELGAMLCGWRLQDGKWLKQYCVSDAPVSGFPLDKVGCRTPFKQCQELAAGGAK